MSIHLGRRRQPQTRRQLALDLIQQLARSAEVADVGHAGTDEHFVDLLALYRRQQAGIVRVVRRAEHRLLDVGQIDFDDFGVLGVLVGFQQLRVGNPGFHRLSTALQGARITVTLFDHPTQQGDVRIQVFDDRLFGQLDGATGSRTLGRGVGQLESLFDAQVVEAFDLQDATGECVLLAFLLYGQQASLNRVVRNGVNQVAQGDARLHLALEANQDRFRHVQRHDARCSSERHQAGTGREGDTDREAGVRVATGADGVRQQHAVQPAVDDAVARTQGNAAAGHDEVRQRVVRLDVDRLRIGRGVAERLHDQIGREAQARQVFQFVAGHRASGVLGTDGGHLRFAVGARTNARYAARLADHLLRQGVTLGAFGWLVRGLEQVELRQAQFGARLAGQATTDDQRNTAASADFVEQHRGLHFEGGDDFVAVVLADLAGVGVDVDHVTHVDVRDIEFDWQSAGIFHGVVEDRSNFAAEAETAGTLVRDVRDVVAEEPEYRVGCRFTRGAGTDHVTDVGNREALTAHFFDLLHRADGALNVRDDAVTGHFQHGQGVQRDVRTRPGIRGRGQVVGVGFAGDLEDAQADLVGQRRALLEPLAVSPGLQHSLGVGIAVLGFFGHVVEGVEHQQGVLELFGCDRREGGVVEQLNQGDDVVATLHGAEQFGGAFFVDQGRSGFALGQGRQETGLDVGSFVNAWRNAIGDQIDKESFFASRGILQQLDQACSLFGVKRLGHDALGGTLFDMFTVGFKHSINPHQWSQMGVRDAHPEIARTHARLIEPCWQSIGDS
ncbi:Multidrug resistance protein AcrA/AcrE family [Pseudomonas syringae pv. solidagae]|nr:Multidrug resistance protein AcrA/AcrE family [Pseudomonas syringae pv. solidagae]